MSDEQKLKNILRASANNGDFVRHGRQNLGKIPGAIENRNTGIFGKITKEDLGQQLSLKQILEQEKSILELLERDSQHKQLLQSNRLDLKDVQERQQRIINLLISQQRGNNDDQIDSSIVNSGNNLYNPEEKTAAEETFLSTVEDLGESGKQFQVEKLIQIPIVEQLSGKVSPREGQFLQISPYKLGKNLRNNVGPSFQVVQVADKSSEEVNNKGALMLIQQNGQQTAEIYGNEEVNVQQKVENLSGDNDSVETFSVEERDALNTAMPS
uniref:Uncharacterized protein n=1 Tax=Meloidogyne hapla TaxID=6305 RepID=A0A1I8BQ12_MELHA